MNGAQCRVGFHWGSWELWERSGIGLGPEEQLTQSQYLSYSQSQRVTTYKTAFHTL